MQFKMFTDGGARGNPGPAGIGVVITDSRGEVLREISEFIGLATNNVAEYRALIRALEEGLDLGVQEAAIFCDSELIVRQIKGEYRVKNKGLIPLYQRAVAMTGHYHSFSINHISRGFNSHADRLVNQAIDGALAGNRQPDAE